MLCGCESGRECGCESGRGSLRVACPNTQAPQKPQFQFEVFRIVSLAHAFSYACRRAGVNVRLFLRCYVCSYVPLPRVRSVWSCAAPFVVCVGVRRSCAT